MSRRFGRNQKRRMRAEIAAVEALADTRLDRARSLADRLRKAESELRYVHDAVRRLNYTGLLPAESVIHYGDPRWWSGRVGQDRLHGFEGVIGNDEAQIMSSFPVIDTYALSLTVEERPIDFAYDVHFFAEGTGKLAGHWAYRISERMLGRGLPRDARARFVDEFANKVLNRADRHFRSPR